MASNTAIKPIETNTKIVGSKYHTHVLPRLEEVYRPGGRYKC